jgi:hypothetical protein
LTRGETPPNLAGVTNPPSRSEKGTESAAARQERLAAALRENLKKRKEQARRRAERPATDDAGG